jgi:SAM-dependent methyltransferase
MDRQALIAAWKKDEAAPFSGWDFSYHAGRVREEEPPWDYMALARAEMAKATAVLDVATGGGERFSQLAPFPGHARAMEGYGPNVFVAQARLEPLGVQVVACGESQPMPFADGEFDLVLNRHGGCWNADLGRVTRPGGQLLTQQVGPGNFADLLEAFHAKSAWPGDWPQNSLEYVSARLVEAGFEILLAKTWAGMNHYLDVGALVYDLKAIPWLVPGFTVEGHLNALLGLQQRVEAEGELSFQQSRFLIKARKR